MPAKYKFITKHGHPNAKGNGQIREHVFVMSQMLGRPLIKEEVVHHHDENKHNNAPSNLKLFASQAEHMAFHKKKIREAECADESLMKCRFCKVFDKPQNMYLAPSGKQAHHRSCSAAYKVHHGLNNKT